MSPSENEEDAKAKVPQDLDPLCLCNFPRSEVNRDRDTYLSSTRGSQSSKVFQNLAESQRLKRRCFWKPSRPRLIQEKLSSSDNTVSQASLQRHPMVPRKILVTSGGFLRKKKQVHRRQRLRRFRREPMHHLPSHLLPSVQAVSELNTEVWPSLTDVLNTITDAWPSSKNLQPYCDKSDLTRIEHNMMRTSKSTSLTRRRSVPEEIMRKFSISNEKTSESEAIVTMPEITSPSSKENEELNGENVLRSQHEQDQSSSILRSNVFSQKIEKDHFWPEKLTPSTKSFTLLEDIARSADEGSSDSDSDAPGLVRCNTIKRTPLRRGSVLYESLTDSPDMLRNGAERASQCDYYRNGMGILKMNKVLKSAKTSKCTCRMSGTDCELLVSEESEKTDSSGTISSPRLCSQPISSSENQSSDSESIKCTCAEIASSKDTSTDLYHSGKSTLSQSVSDKNTSTQDSTASINSVSSHGSTAATDYSSTDMEHKTSAKETTTSPDYTPRPPSKRSKSGDEDRSSDSDFRTHSKHCPRYVPNQGNIEPNAGAPKARSQEASIQTDEVEKEEKNKQTNKAETQQTRRYEWAESPYEGLCHIQQQRNENSTGWDVPMTFKRNDPSAKVTVCTNTGSSYSVTNNFHDDFQLMIPRYSALPRTMSMVVNSSSFEASHYSDSDCQSLADSLEEGCNRQELNYFDTKQELKPVRGDVKEILAQQKNKIKKKEPRGRAYFFAMDDDGGAELVTNIHKIPELPEELKQKIAKRHEKICKNVGKNNLEKERPNTKLGRHRLVKKRSKGGRSEVKNCELVRSKLQNTTLPSKEPNPDVEIQKTASLSIKTNTMKGLKSSTTFVSKIPMPILTDRSKESQSDMRKESPQNQTEQQGISNKFTAIEENNTPRKPQAVIHPSQSVSTSQASNSSPIQLATTSPYFSNLEFNTEHQAAINTTDSKKAHQNSQRQSNHSQKVSKPKSKFQQRFEVIPEERSSSLTSSADELKSEKNRRRSLPVKLTESSKSSTLLRSSGEAGGKSFRRYSLESLSSYVITKLMGRPLQAIPCVQRGPNNENQKIIIFSPKDPSGSNSSKGRDALLAMNREDFNRLSKGWMNFYLLKESSGSDTEPEDNKTSSSRSKSEALDETARGEQEPETIVCRMPSMVKDLTTSGSGTDDASTSIKHLGANRNYSLFLKNIETNYFQLEECPDESTTAQGKNDLSDDSSNTKSDGNGKKMLGLIPEEAEIKDEQKLKKDIFYALSNESSSNGNLMNRKDASTEIDETFNQTLETRSSRIGLEPLHHLNAKTFNLQNDIKKEEDSRHKQSEPPLMLTVPVKLGSSNAMLSSKKIIKVSPRNTPQPSSGTFSLPELSVEQSKKSIPTKSASLVESLPKVRGASSESADTDTDSTMYLNAPRHQVPRLPLEDCCGFYSDTSTESESTRRMTDTREKHVPLRRRPLPFRPKNRFAFHEAVHGKKPGWSVTVEGTLAFPRARPDVQMRLSFPVEGGLPFASQSDSGFVEDQKINCRTISQQKQQWTVTVKNPPSGSGKEKHRSACKLPNVNRHSPPLDHNSKKGPKLIITNREKTEISKKLLRVWPKVQEVIESELKAITDDFIKSETEPLLSVEGRAMPFDVKPRASRMSERDFTRNSTARSNSKILDVPHNAKDS